VEEELIVKNKKWLSGILICSILFGGFLGIKTSVVFGQGKAFSQEQPPQVKILAERGSQPEKALNTLPEDVKNKIKKPKKFPFETENLKNYAQSQQFGKNKYYYEEYWVDNGNFFFFNVLNGTPKTDENFNNNPGFTFTTIEIYEGIKATYVTGPTSEKLYWNDNGYQYMIGDNSKNGKVDFYGSTKLAEIALSFQ
jgi:hypothetical protein